MRRRTERGEGLDLIGEVADIEHYEAGARWDVVILDRVLHMLATDERRRVLLRRACG